MLIKEIITGVVQGIVTCNIGNSLSIMLLWCKQLAGTARILLYYYYICLSVQSH